MAALDWQAIASSDVTLIFIPLIIYAINLIRSKTKQSEFNRAVTILSVLVTAAEQLGLREKKDYVLRQPARDEGLAPFAGEDAPDFIRELADVYEAYLGSGLTSPYVGGKDGKGRISLHSLETGQRLTLCVKPADCKFLCYASWRTRVAA